MHPYLVHRNIGRTFSVAADKVGKINHLMQTGYIIYMLIICDGRGRLWDLDVVLFWALNVWSNSDVYRRATSSKWCYLTKQDASKTCCAKDYDSNNLKMVRCMAEK